MKIELWHMNPGPGANSEELAKVLLARFGLLPRKVDAKAQFHRLLLELYERKKHSLKERKPELAVMSVDQMAAYAGIARQTFYEYMARWLTLQVIKKTSFVADKRLTTGYELNGNNLEAAFARSKNIVEDHTQTSIEIAKGLQTEIKKEKLRAGKGDETLLS